MHFFGKTLREKGISREVRKILAAGWRKFTIKTYHYLINDTLSTDIPKDGMLWIKIIHILSFLSHYIMGKISF